MSRHSEKASKCYVSISTTDDATPPPVGEHTSVPGVAAPSQESHAAGVMPRRARSHLHPQEWAHILSMHPNQQYASLLNDYIKNGVPIMYTGPEFTLISPNWKSTEMFRNDVIACIENDLSLGRKSGPYKSPHVQISGPPR
jgi:hypothetical protein